MNKAQQKSTTETPNERTVKNPVWKHRANTKTKLSMRKLKHKNHPQQVQAKGQ
jgi:hypothetical protein